MRNSVPFETQRCMPTSVMIPEMISRYTIRLERVPHQSGIMLVTRPPDWSHKAVEDLTLANQYLERQMVALVSELEPRFHAEKRLGKGERILSLSENKGTSTEPSWGIIQTINAWYFYNLVYSDRLSPLDDFLPHKSENSLLSTLMFADKT